LYALAVHLAFFTGFSFSTESENLKSKTLFHFHLVPHIVHCGTWLTVVDCSARPERLGSSLDIANLLLPAIASQLTQLVYSGRTFVLRERDLRHVFLTCHFFFSISIHHCVVGCVGFEILLDVEE